MTIPLRSWHPLPGSVGTPPSGSPRPCGLDSMPASLLACAGPAEPWGAGSIRAGEAPRPAQPGREAAPGQGLGEATLGPWSQGWLRPAVRGPP